MNKVFRRVGGAFAALALILGFGSVMPAMAAESPRGDNLAIPMTEAEFVDAAVDVAGLTKAEARSAYADPEVAATVPVEVVPAIGSKMTTSRSGDALAASAFTCEIWMAVEQNNAFGQKLFTYRIDKYFESDRSEVLYSDVVETGSVTDLGEIGTWVYEGTIESSDGYREYNAAHFSQRTGEFVNLEGVPELEFRSQHILQMLVRANGEYVATWPGLDHSVSGSCFD